jgi:hypothetical protein
MDTLRLYFTLFIIGDDGMRGFKGRRVFIRLGAVVSKKIDRLEFSHIFCCKLIMPQLFFYRLESTHKHILTNSDQAG